MPSGPSGVELMVSSVYDMMTGHQSPSNVGLLLALLSSSSGRLGTNMCDDVRYLAGSSEAFQVMRTCPHQDIIAINPPSELYSTGREH